MKFPTYCTTVSNSDGVTRIVYHRTTVVRFDADDITLQDGGWQTVTTKRRMNQASEYFNLGFQVYQKNYFGLLPHSLVLYKMRMDMISKEQILY